MPLVLSRGVGEAILVGHDILVYVTEVRGPKARILIDAPKDTRIMRTEILERKGERLPRLEQLRQRQRAIREAKRAGDSNEGKLEEPHGGAVAGVHQPQDF